MNPQPVTLKKGQLIELTVEQAAFGGKGLARVDGLAVFVEAAVPGDRVLARIVRKKKSFAEARVAAIVQPSPDRVIPACSYSGSCGGCKWQFLAYARQLAYKRQQVSECLEHIGALPGVPVHPTLPAEKIFAYRNKMEFSCATRRWLSPAEMERGVCPDGPTLGLHVPGTFDKVLDIARCHLQPDLGNTLLAEVRRFIQGSPLPVYGLRSHEGFWRFVVLRHCVLHDQWLVNLVTAGEARAAVQALADTLVEKYPQVAAVVNNVSARRAAVAVGEYEIRLAGRPFLIERIGNYTFEISANSFFQTNTRQAAQLYDQVARYAALSGDETVVDLYCGAGTIAIYLAAQARAVVGLEIATGAVADAQRNARRNDVANVRFIAGDLRHTLPQIEVRPQVMIIDPPRAGMHADVVRQVLALAPERIVYVSCNPATLARDLIPLKEAYEVAEVQPVDMFPHTFHIEAVARLIKKNS